MLDSAIKGPEHLAALGPLYLWRQSILAALAVVATFVEDRRFHAGFLIFALLAQLAWIAQHFEVLD
jgi:hypothetical protein